MQTKLFYEDAYKTSFFSKVLKQDKDQKGNHFIVLEKTLFYPTGGGQPHDTGTIDGINVYDVQEAEGEVRHYIDHPLSSIHSEVEGKIDWERRFDHMQQHAGQHILTAAFEEMFQYETVAFHLGEDNVTIDLNIADLSEEVALKVENYANEIILRNISIQTKWVTEEEADKLPLRKKLAAHENVRLVIIPDFDYNGCGGTHPNKTGEVQALKILGWEKQNKKIRISFLCGKRILKELQKKERIMRELTELLNSPEEKLPDAVIQQMEIGKENKKKISHLEESLVAYEKQSLLHEAVEMKDYLFVSNVFSNKKMQELQKLGRELCMEAPNGIVLLINVEDDQLQFICGRGKSVTCSMKLLGEGILALINGKGGGNDSFVQGGGEATVPADQVIQLVLDKI
ncbi:alanine--tRNA ligase-related protein [Evansella sp. AB-rgal1]|uniref:alanyl-tRNA editing protein n=1 Tax=Evansella sp. AB-rgal1 TaxID=3242696 RepID=UPI00359CC5FB